MSGVPPSCFTVKEKCNYTTDSWNNGLTDSTPTWSSFIKKASAKAAEDMLCWKRLRYLRNVAKIIRLCTFVSLAACQWRIRWSRPHPTCSWGSEVWKTDAITKMPQQYACSQDLLGIVPASSNDALSTARLTLSKGRRKELCEGGACQGPSLSLSDLRRFNR